MSLICPFGRGFYTTFLKNITETAFFIHALYNSVTEMPLLKHALYNTASPISLICHFLTCLYTTPLKKITETPPWKWHFSDFLPEVKKSKLITGLHNFIRCTNLSGRAMLFAKQSLKPLSPYLLPGGSP